MNNSTTITVPLTAMNSAYIGWIYDPHRDWYDFEPRLVWTGQTNPHDKFRALVTDDELDEGGYVVGHIQSNPFGYPFPTLNVYTIQRDGSGFIIMQGIRKSQQQSNRVVTWPPK